MKSHLQQRLTLRALTFKFNSLNESMTDIVLRQNPESEANKYFKNVCTPLTLPVVERLEKTLSTLGMSKREFIQSAIVDALEQADQIMKDVDLMEFEREISHPDLDAEVA